MKAMELRELDADSLQTKAKELDDQLFRMRIQKSMGQLEAPGKIRNVRRELAAARKRQIDGRMADVPQLHPERIGVRTVRRREWHDADGDGRRLRRRRRRRRGAGTGGNHHQNRHQAGQSGHRMPPTPILASRLKLSYSCRVW